MEEQRKRVKRGIPLAQQRLWNYQIEKEDKLRLSWFKRNEQRLEETAERKNLRQVPEEVKQEMKERMVQHFRQEDRHVKQHFDEDYFWKNLEERALYHVMRPVPKEVTNLIYSSNLNDGRMTYLTERYKVIPEERYYFPETTSFQYGWQMYKHAKELQGSKFARQQVIQDSFYRRRAGVERDPDWYTEPAKLSPNVCGCI